MLERLDIYIDFTTSLQDIELLRAEMEKFVADPENKRDFQPDILIRCVSVGSMDKLQLQLEVRHKSNWSVENVRATRHSKLICALVLALRKIPINGPGGGAAALGDPTNPAYSVTVTDDVAASARQKAVKDADAARLYPNTTVGSIDPSKTAGVASPLSTISESVAAGNINANEDPLQDLARENDDVDIVDAGIDSALSNARRGTEASGNSRASGLELQHTRSPQGRRRRGSMAPIVAVPSRISRQDSNAVESLTSRNSLSGNNFDYEAQNGR